MSIAMFVSFCSWQSTCLWYFTLLSVAPSSANGSDTRFVVMMDTWVVTWKEPFLRQQCIHEYKHLCMTELLATFFRELLSSSGRWDPDRYASVWGAAEFIQFFTQEHDLQFAVLPFQRRSSTRCLCMSSSASQSSVEATKKTVVHACVYMNACMQTCIYECTHAGTLCMYIWMYVCK